MHPVVIIAMTYDEHDKRSYSEKERHHGRGENLSCLEEYPVTHHNWHRGLGMVTDEHHNLLDLGDRCDADHKHSKTPAKGAKTEMALMVKTEEALKDRGKERRTATNGIENANKAMIMFYEQEMMVMTEIEKLNYELKTLQQRGTSQTFKMYDAADVLYENGGNQSITATRRGWCPTPGVDPGFKMESIDAASNAAQAMLNKDAANDEKKRASDGTSERDNKIPRLTDAFKHEFAELTDAEIMAIDLELDDLVAENDTNHACYAVDYTGM